MATKRLTKAQLLDLLRARAGNTGDPEGAHIEADDALLAYINDPEVTAAFNAITMWYA